MDKILGTIKFFMKPKNYGFIVYESNGIYREIFFHHNEFVDKSILAVDSGVKVRFSIGQSDLKPGKKTAMGIEVVSDDTISDTEKSKSVNPAFNPVLAPQKVA